MVRHALIVAALFASPLLLRTQGWPQFRGPGSTGVAEGSNLPDTWSTTQNVKWKAAIPGHGWSSPIAWGDRIFVRAVIPVGETEVGSDHAIEAFAVSPAFREISPEPPGLIA